jgi:opacity protein-like surface antigen
MKKTLLLLALLVPIFSFAQTEKMSERQFQHQVGFDATIFLKQFVVMNNNFFGGQNPFSFVYKGLLYNPDRTILNGVRVGVGFQNNNQLTDPDSSTERSSNFNSMAYRLGFERQYVLSRHWLIYLGADVMYSRTKNKTESHFKGGPSGEVFRTTNWQSSYTMGAGPVLGIQFDINKRMCLSTEAAFTLQNSTSAFRTESTFPGAINNPESKTITQNIGFVLPAFINFNVKL